MSSFLLLLFCVLLCIMNTFAMWGSHGSKGNDHASDSNQNIDPVLDSIDSADTDKCSTNHRHRKAWHTLTDYEKNLYATAFVKLNEMNITQTFTATHANDYNLHQGHASAAFLPWHRYYLWELESVIRDLGDEYKCFSLPYWDFSYETTQTNNVHDWDILSGPLGGSGDPEDDYCITDESVFGKGNGYNPLLCWEDTEPAADGSCCLVRQSCDIAEDGCCSMHNPSEMMDMILSHEIYGTDSNLGPNPPEYEVYGFYKLLEMRHGFGHDIIGGWVSETRTSLGHIANLSYSPDDPIFYLLHSYVDYNWALWQDCHDYDLVNENDINLDIYGGTLDQDPDGINQEWGPSTIDIELKYEPVSNAHWSYMYMNGWTITPRDMHDLNKWDISYDKGTFFESAKVERNCENINSTWFYLEETCDRNFNINSEFSDESYNLLEEQLSLRGKTKKEIVHNWAKLTCEWDKSQRKDECSSQCQRPKYFDDCSDLERDPATKDIIVTLNELLEKVEGVACMENTRRRYWNWAVQTNKLLQLCRGDFDHFCDDDFIHDNKPNKCVKDQGISNTQNSQNSMHENISFR